MKRFLFGAACATFAFASSVFANPHSSLWMIYNDSDTAVYVECKTANRDPGQSSDFKTAQIPAFGSTKHKAVVDGDRTNWSCTASTSNAPFSEPDRQIISFSVGKTEIVNLHVKVVAGQIMVVRH